MNIREAQKNISSMLAARGNDNAARETELMLQHVLGCDRVWLFTHGDDVLSAEDDQRLAILFNERMVGRPLQYLLGTAPFLELEIEVTEDVLIPRPETELLAKEAEAFLKDHKGPSVLDLCTGSGAIAAWLAAHFPEANIAASDVSPWALAVARKNCPPSVDLRPSDLFEELPYTYDLIVSNPPYIPAAEIEKLQPEVRYYEPRLALDGGADGLDLIRRIIAEAPAHLNAGGALMMEIGHDQGPAVLELAAQAGLRGAEVLKDMDGHDRILKAVK